MYIALGRALNFLTFCFPIYKIVVTQVLAEVIQFLALNKFGFWIKSNALSAVRIRDLKLLAQKMENFFSFPMKSSDGQ